MSTNGQPPATNGRDPLRADEWLEARHAANREQTSPFARGRATRAANGTPPPPAPALEDQDPTSLPIFAGAWASEQEPPGRSRSEFSLRPLVAPAPEEHPRTHGTDGEIELDWELIAQYRAEISSRLTARLDKEGGRVTEEDREQMGLDVIEELIKSEAETLVSTGRPPWTPAQEKALKSALHAALFGLGRLQPLVEREDVENIIVIARGPDCAVWLELVDGTLVEAAPIADSEDELREFLSDLGARQNRPFTEARPHLDLRLPGGARLAAGSWVMAYTSVVIRRHGLREVSMDEMVYDRKACSPVLADFVAACVRAGKSIVVSGVQGSGKALALDTPIPTPDGWTTMGDLRRGDVAFDDEGKPCRVIEAHPVQYDRPCYEVEFDDGATIVADADHLWEVERRAGRKRGRSNGPDYEVDHAERERLWQLALAAAEEGEQHICSAELHSMVGEQNGTALREVLHKLGPTGHMIKGRTGRWGHEHHQVYTYDKQLVLKELAVRRSTPRGVGHHADGASTAILTTAEIAENIWVSEDKPYRTYNHSVRLTKALTYSTKDQPIDPYLLGIWLGDGTSGAARVSTADPEVVAAFETRGYPCRLVAGYDYQVGGGFHRSLRMLGLLGDKHIPRIYLQGDAEQRLALLQGLMDSDGTVTKRAAKGTRTAVGGSVEFSNTNQLLAEQVRELTIGLGFKAHIRSKAAMYEGRPCGTSYTVAWTTNTPVFRLPRKRDLQATCNDGPRARKIVAVRPVASVPVRCISVDAPSALFLASRSCIPTHNTTWVRALCSCIPPWEMIGTFETEFELHLHELVDRHKIVHAWEHRPGSGEVGIDGRQAGEFSLEEAIHHSFRFNLARQIVGEVRGPEVWNMLKAMESGPGSISTTHARSAEHTIEKLVSCAMEKGPQVTRELAISKLAAAIDIVMYLRSEVVPNDDGTFRKQRWVEEVLVVQPSIDAARGYATTPIFAPNQLGQAVATGKLDNFLAQELARHGFDLEAYKAESQANPGVATS